MVIYELVMINMGGHFPTDYQTRELHHIMYRFWCRYREASVVLFQFCDCYLKWLVLSGGWKERRVCMALEMVLLNAVIIASVSFS